MRESAGRPVYRWWSTKAEILLEACTDDVREELDIAPRADPGAYMLAYLEALTTFLTASPAGLAYRALVGEAQHDPAVRDLVGRADLLTRSTYAVLDHVRASAAAMPSNDLAAAQLTGPLIVRVLTGPAALPTDVLRAHVESLLTAWRTAGREP